MKRTLTALLIALAPAGAATAATTADKSVVATWTSWAIPMKSTRTATTAWSSTSRVTAPRWSRVLGGGRFRQPQHPRDLVAGVQRQTAVPGGRANRLLEDSQDAKMGGWVKQDTTAMFVVKIDADATPDQLSDAIDAAIRTADAMELERPRRTSSELNATPDPRWAPHATVATVVVDATACCWLKRPSTAARC